LQRPPVGATSKRARRFCHCRSATARAAQGPTCSSTLLPTGITSNGHGSCSRGAYGGLFSIRCGTGFTPRLEAFMRFKGCLYVAVAVLAVLALWGSCLHRGAHGARLDTPHAGYRGISAPTQVMARAAELYSIDAPTAENPKPAAVAPITEDQSAAPQQVQQGGETSQEPVVNHSGAVWEPVQAGGR